MPVADREDYQAPGAPPMPLPAPAGTVCLSALDVFVADPPPEVVYVDFGTADPSSDQRISTISASGLTTHSSHAEQKLPTTDLISTLRQAIPKIRRLTDLEPGWDSYGAPRIDIGAADRAIAILIQLLERGAPSPAIAPGASGGVHLEWYLDPRYVEISVAPSGRTEVYFEDQSTAAEWDKILGIEITVAEVARVLRAPTLRAVEGH